MGHRPLFYISLILIALLPLLALGKSKKKKKKRAKNKYKVVCPQDTTYFGGKPPKHEKEFCGRENPDGTLVKHGPYQTWFVGVLAHFPEERGEYCENVKCGTWTTWYPSGEKASEAGFQNGVLHGAKTKWFTNATRGIRIEYFEGAENGSIEQWFRDGSTRLQGGLKNGKVHGKLSIWYPGGQAMAECSFTDGQYDGPCRLWRSDGSLVFSNHYAKGQEHGVLTVWRDDGTKIMETAYSNGKRSQPIKVWYAKGGLALTQDISVNGFEKKTFYDRGGNEVSEVKLSTRSEQRKVMEELKKRLVAGRRLIQDMRKELYALRYVKVKLNAARIR